MRKYDFVREGAEVIWHNDETDEVQMLFIQRIYGSSEDIDGDTMIVIGELEETHQTTVSQVIEAPSEFDSGYWRALQDAVTHGVGDSVIAEMFGCAGFSMLECLWHAQESDFQSETLLRIARETFLDEYGFGEEEESEDE